MTRGHEELVVYRHSIDEVVRVFEKAGNPNVAHRFVDLTESISIPIAISIAMERNPNERLHGMLILRASALFR